MSKHKVSKNDSLYKHKQLLMFIAAAGVFLSIALLVIFELTQRTNTNSTSDPTVLPISKIEGKVTRINSDGRDYVLDENGSKVRGPAYGITDTGASISVDDQTIQTSSAGPTKYPYHVDVSHIDLGDYVTVTYTTTNSGFKSLDCKQCSILK